jgi:hypothetical protein
MDGLTRGKEMAKTMECNYTLAVLIKKSFKDIERKQEIANTNRLAPILTMHV